MNDEKRAEGVAVLSSAGLGVVTKQKETLMDKEYNSVPMKIVATLSALPAHELEALRKDADRWAFAAEHWCSLIGGIPLHRWLDEQKLRRGGLTAALDYAMNYHQNGERHIA